MKTRTQLDERSFEQLLAAAYLLQQQREPIPFPGKRTVDLPTASSRYSSPREEDERLAAIAEAHAIVHGKQLRLQETLQLVIERALRITGGSGAAIWLVRGRDAMCQAACGTSALNAGKSISIGGSRLTACLRDGAIFRCADAMSDPRTRYDALPGAAPGALVAVPIHYEGRVQGALEVTFEQAGGFAEADVRTCQILSGLVSETVAVAAGQEKAIILESERATLLEALDRIQPHLSKLLDEAGAQDARQKRGDAEENDETPLPPVGLPLAPAGPTHGLARLGKYLLDQQEQGGSVQPEQATEKSSKSVPREVHTALNFSVASKQPVSGDHSLEHDFGSQEWEPSGSEPPTQAAYTPAAEPDLYEPDLVAHGNEPWALVKTEAPVTAEPAVPSFWRSHWADACLVASIAVLAVSLSWAFWPRPAKTVTASDAAAASEPKLSAFEELLVSMGLAEAPPPPAAYAGTPGTRVWVDINSALYYCPGAEPYGKTPKGKFLTQHDAQVEQFQPARGQPCE